MVNFPTRISDCDSQFPLTFHQIHSRMLYFIAQFMTILVLIVMGFVIIREVFLGKISLNSELLLLLVNFVSGFRLELMYISRGYFRN